MNKTFKKTYVAVGSALTLFAALSLTLMPSIAWALTASAPLTAADGVINLPISDTSTNACGTSKRLSVVQVNGAPALKCVDNPTDNEGVTSISELANSSGLVVDNTTAATPVLSLLDCAENEILVAGDGTSDYDCAAQSSVTAIPALITFTTNTPLSSGAGTIYASLSGSLGTLGPMLTPFPAGTYKNLACRNSVATGNTTSTVEFFTGPCAGTTATSGTLKITLPNSTAAAGSIATTSSTIDFTNNCGVIKITKTANYDSGIISCSLQKTS